MQRSYVNHSGQVVHLPYGFHLTNVMEPIREFFDIFDRPPLSIEARRRFQWIDYHKRGHNVSLTCRHFNIPRKTFYLWLHRYEKAGAAGLEDLDHTPKRKRQRKCTPVQEERIVALRTKYIRYGKEKLALIYMKEYGESISAWQIQKVIEKYRMYYNPKKTARIASKRKKSLNKKRITELKKKSRTGYLVCIDTVVIYWNSMKRYIFTAVDHYSKLAFARMYTTKSSRNAKDFLLRLNHLMDGKIDNINRDNGSEFKGEFDKALTELRIDGYFSRVKTPKDNAVNERFNRTKRNSSIWETSVLIQKSLTNAYSTGLLNTTLTVRIRPWITKHPSKLPVEKTTCYRCTHLVQTWVYLVKGGKIILMKAFLYHVLNNLIIDEYRKQKHRMESLDVLLENGFEPKDEQTDRLVNILDGKTAVNRITELPDKYKKIMYMRFAQSMSLQDISTVTGQTKNTTSVQIHRGLQKLKVLCGYKSLPTIN